MKLKCQCNYIIPLEHGHQENTKLGIKVLHFKCGKCGKIYSHVKYLNGEEEVVEGYVLK